MYRAIGRQQSRLRALSERIILNPMSTAPPVWFDAALYPHRSLSARGFFLLMAALSAVSFTAGMIFVLKGAWPVLGFFGLDVALVYWAFRVNYRRAEIEEIVRLDDTALTVARHDRNGVQEWTFQPYWVRVELDGGPWDDNRLRLTSHGRDLYIGDFLTAPERIDLAAALREALARQRANPSTSAMP